MPLCSFFQFILYSDKTLIPNPRRTNMKACRERESSTTTTDCSEREKQRAVRSLGHRVNAEHFQNRRPYIHKEDMSWHEISGCKMLAISDDLHYY